MVFSFQMDSFFLKIIKFMPQHIQFLDMGIDMITPCLIHKSSGERYLTEYYTVTLADLSHVSPKYGWNECF
jgi:hypothetical protein